MYVLTGIRNSCKGTEEATRDEIAVFDNLDDLRKYLEKSKTRAYQHPCIGQCDKQFRKESLLYGYCSYDYGAYRPSHLPNNPKFLKKRKKKRD